ncbi:hypothetical protein [Planctobacterium marinum]|uniref:Uncharacterized protein n=1 Tax=Planctobacterium marinum TaxID=1631968 RepID=A0AA48KQG8_9ALTE|nr:hypothetical protein MACH26_32770 [Planctobacterium marinum]
MSDLLKGNFKTKKTVSLPKQAESDSKADEFKKEALNSIGGSMVFVERTPLEWNGDEDKS